MAASPTSSVQAPWHLWVVGVLSLLWNGMGAMDFTLTQVRSAAYLRALTPEQLAYFQGIPSWAVLAWGLATWGSMGGSLLLLLRRGFAVQLFLVSFLGMVTTMVYNYALTDGLKAMGGGVGSVIFSAVIGVVAGLLLIYARATRRSGVLR